MIIYARPGSILMAIKSVELNEQKTAISSELTLFEVNETFKFSPERPQRHSYPRARFS